MASNKKKVMTTVIAAALATAMVAGGASFAYLQSQSDTVKNNFNTNKVLVTLDETTGDDYDIIPGTQQDKDPKVTIDNTVDSWLFVTVTDNTDGLVNYQIADGWTELEDANAGENKKVYYREVAGNAAAADKTFSVLKGDKVSYNAALTNDDMLENGELKTNLALSFDSFAIQKANFDNAANAYRAEPTVPVNNGDGLQNALDDINNSDSTDPVTVVLDPGTVVDPATGEETPAPVNMDDTPLNVGEDKNVTIDLNGHDLTITNTGNDAISVADGGTLTITDSKGTGVLRITSDNQNTDSIYVTNNTAGKTTTVNLEDIHIIIDNCNYEAIHADADDGTAVLNINEGTVIDVIGDGTKQITGVMARKNSVINLNGGVINVDVGGASNANVDAVGITLMNYNHNTSATLNITDGTINVNGAGAMAVQTGYGYGQPGNIITMSGGTINVNGNGAVGFGIMHAADVNITGGTINVDTSTGEAYAFSFYYGDPSLGVVQVANGVVNLADDTKDFLTDTPDRVNVATE